jgi:hypothetical protein
MKGYAKIEATTIIKACENYKLAFYDSKKAYEDYIQELKNTKVRFLLFFKISRYSKLDSGPFGSLQLYSLVETEKPEAKLYLSGIAPVNYIMNQALISDGNVLCNTVLAAFIEKWSDKA